MKTAEAKSDKLPPGPQRQDRGEIAELSEKNKEAGAEQGSGRLRGRHAGQDAERGHIDGESGDDGEHAALDKREALREARPGFFVPEIDAGLRIAVCVKRNGNARLRVAGKRID